MDEVIIIGGGVAGLSCAIELHRAGVPFLLLEAQERVGGRIRTDEIDGFLCDRGFQILLTAYPEAADLLDYQALDLRPFYPGALIWFDGAFHRLADPFRRPLDAVRSARSPIGSLLDKARILRLRQAVQSGTLAELYARPQTTTLARLRAAGLSTTMIERFFRPFLGGVFLEPELSTSSRKFEFVFRMFASGDNALPAGGMEAIPRQLASRLPREHIRTCTKVECIRPGKVVLTTGETLTARAIVVATDGDEAARLIPGLPVPTWHPVTCLYFAAERPPVAEPILILDGSGRGPVNNLCVVSEVAPPYAPPGRSLISLSVLRAADLPDDRLRNAVIDQMKTWFGPSVSLWRHLKTFRIPRAVPAQPPEALEPVEPPCAVQPGIFVSGDHRHLASINGAMASGRRAAREVLRSLG